MIRFFRNIWNHALMVLKGSNDKGVTSSNKDVEELSQNIYNKSEYHSLFKTFIVNGNFSEAKEMLDHGYKVNKDIQEEINKNILYGVNNYYFHLSSTYLDEPNIKILGSRNEALLKYIAFIVDNGLVNLDTISKFKGMNQGLNKRFHEDRKDSESLRGSIEEDNFRIGFQDTFEKDGASTEALKWLNGKASCYRISLFLQECDVDFNRVKTVEDFTKFKSEKSGLTLNEISKAKEDKLYLPEGRSRKDKYVCFYELLIPEIIRVLVEKNGVEPSAIMKIALKNTSRNVFNAGKDMSILVFKNYPEESLENLSKSEIDEFREVFRKYLSIQDVKNGGVDIFSNNLSKFIDAKFANADLALLNKFKKEARKQAQLSSNVTVISYLSMAQEMKLSPEFIERLNYIKEKVDLLKDKSIDVESKHFLESSEKSIVKILELFKELRDLDNSVDIKTFLFDPIHQIDKKIQEIDNHYQENQIKNLTTNNSVTKVRVGY